MCISVRNEQVELPHETKTYQNETLYKVNSRKKQKLLEVAQAVKLYREKVRDKCR